MVVPPGAGKTLILLEAARHLGRRTLVLCPNTAIQAQWLGQWSAAFAPLAVAATASSDLPTPLTILTYQAVCTGSSIHQDGRWLLSQLSASGPVTLVLDECHHLLEVWGRVLREVVAQLGQASPYPGKRHACQNYQFEAIVRLWEVLFVPRGMACLSVSP